MELGNIFELILLFCHVPSELSGEPEIPVWGLMPRVPVICHPAVPTNLFIFGGPFCFGQLVLGWGILWRDKVNKGSDRFPHQQPQIPQPHVFWLYLLVSFPVLVGCLPFGDPDNASPLPFQVPTHHLIESRFLPCF